MKAERKITRNDKKLVSWGVL